MPHGFLGLDGIQEEVGDRRKDYSESRPHSAKGNVAPEDFALGIRFLSSKNPSAKGLYNDVGNLQLAS
jgi:hypothetical protein